MEKLLVMYVAAQLANASSANASPTGGLPVSADISDPNVRAKNLMVWEDFRIFYHAIINALGDDNADTGWPAPKISLANLLSLGNLGATVGQLVNSVVPAPATVTPAPLPNPGK